jgi:hypothetical protein
MIMEAIYFVRALDNTYSCDRSTQLPSCADYFYNFMETLGKLSGSYYGILSLSLVITYVKLNLALKSGFSHEVSDIILKSLNILFGVLVVSYVLRTIFLYLQGTFHTFIKSYDVRFELELLLWPIFDFMCFVPIFIMQRKNYTVRTVLEPGLVTSSDDQNLFKTESEINNSSDSSDNEDPDT